MYKRTKIEAEVHPRFLCLEEFMNYTGLGRGSAMKLGKEIGCVMKVGKGWYVGKTKMKDWKASVRTWENNQRQKNKKSKDDEGLEGWLNA